MNSTHTMRVTHAFVTKSRPNKDSQNNIRVKRSYPAPHALHLSLADFNVGNVCVCVTLLSLLADLESTVK